MRFKLISKSAYFPELKLLAIADLHLGYEQALIEQGVFLPRSRFKETIEDFEKIFLELKKNKQEVEGFVIVGDLKHEFSGNLNQEWKEVLKLLEFLQEKIGKNGKIIIVKGNHDNFLVNVIKDKAKFVDFYIKKEICFVHGHKLFVECLDKKIKTLVLGHKHPAVTLKDKIKSERYKCFLAGRWKGKEILILPSFFPLVEGSDVSREDLEDTNLAFKLNLSKFRVYVPVPGETKVLEFKKIVKN